jgi:hypothetical protein
VTPLLNLMLRFGQLPLISPLVPSLSVIVVSVDE